MTPAQRFERLADLLAADLDLQRRGRWVETGCRIEIGTEPFHLVLRGGDLVELARGSRVMRSISFSIRGSDDAWHRHWQRIPEPGWHDLFALAKRGAVAIDGDLRPLLRNLQYFKDLLALPRRLPEDR